MRYFFFDACKWQRGVFNKFVRAGSGRTGLSCILACINKSIKDPTIVGAMHNLDPTCFCLQKGGKYVENIRYQSCHFK